MSNGLELTSFTLESIGESLRDEVLGSRSPMPAHEVVSWNWFTAYLDREIAAWISGSALRKDSREVASDEVEPLEVEAYNKILDLLKALKHVERGSTLADIMATPTKHQCLAVGERSETDFAFHAIGWFTGLWDARPSEGTSQPVLCIDDPGRHTRSSRFWSNASCLGEFGDANVSIEDARNMPLSALVDSAFGKLLPKPSRFGSGDVEAGVSSKTVPTTYLSWQKSGFKIRWTAILAQHLEIDEKKREIAVYQHPSKVLLMLCMGKDSPLARIFAADADDQRHLQASLRTHVRRPMAIVGFCEEMIRSYLLLFGARAWLPACISRQQSGVNMALPPQPDPLLLELMRCRKDVQESPLLKVVINWPQIDGQVVLDWYPFLGAKLVEVARIGRGFKMPRPWHVCHDRHNPNGWTVFWLLGMLGLFALLMQFLQLAAQIKSIE